MASRHIEQIDTQTGELLQGCMVYIPYRPKLTERFFMAFQDAFIEIAKDDELTLEPKNVLFYLFGQLNFENFLHLSQTDIATALSMQRSHVSRAMKLLITKGIVLDGPKVGRVKTYRLNPDYGWKGRVTHLDKYRQDQRDRIYLVQGGKIAQADIPAPTTETMVSVSHDDP